MKPEIVIVATVDRGYGHSVCKALKRDKMDIRFAADLKKVLRGLDSRGADVVLLDSGFGLKAFEEFLPAVRRLYSERETTICVIPSSAMVVTADGTFASLLKNQGGICLPAPLTEATAATEIRSLVPKPMNIATIREIVLHCHQHDAASKRVLLERSEIQEDVVVYDVRYRDESWYVALGGTLGLKALASLADEQLGELLTVFYRSANGPQRCWPSRVHAIESPFGLAVPSDDLTDIIKSSRAALRLVIAEENKKNAKLEPAIPLKLATKTKTG